LQHWKFTSMANVPCRLLNKRRKSL
jgi:hypothetical protein